MAQNGSTVAGRKVEVILKDDAGVADTTRRIAQELVVNDKVDGARRLRPHAAGAGHRADRHAEQDADGRDGGGHVEHHRGIAVHRPHQLHAAAGHGCASPTGRRRTASRRSSRWSPTTARASTPRSSSSSQFTAATAARWSASCACRCATPTSRRSCRGCATPSPMRCSSSCRRASGRGLHEAVRRARPRQVAASSLIATGDVTDDDILNDMGDVALGVVNSHHYSAAHRRRRTRSSSRRSRRRTSSAPELHGGRRLRRHARHLQGARGDQGRGRRRRCSTAMKGQIFESPRGPVLIDAQTRDIVQDVYIRKVERVRRQPALQRRVRRDQAGEGPGQGEVTRLPAGHADPALRRHRLRHAAVRAGRRAGGDAGADELHQPRARRLRDGRRLRHRAADEPRRRAVPRLPADRLRRRRRCSARCSSARSTGRCTRRPHLDQVLFSIGLVFMAVDGGRLLRRLACSRTSSCRRGCRVASTSSAVGIGTLPALHHRRLRGCWRSALQWVLSRTRFGSRLRAAVDDPRVASGLGLDVNRIFLADLRRRLAAWPASAARSAPRCSGSIRRSRSSS